MSNSPGSAPLTRAQSDMMTQVDAILGRHPRIQPLLERGWTLDLGCNDTAIWVTAVGPERSRAEARLDAPRWWLPSRSGRALAITEELVQALESALSSTD
ncbi:MAG TPA: hypothetical protein VF167_00215 [Longimicrobiaceae bacterium]